MPKRLLLLLLIVLLPVQGIAASFMPKCVGMTVEQAMPATQAPCHDMAASGDDAPAPPHDREASGGSPGSDHCCHNFSVAIPQGFALPGVELAPGPHYPAPAYSYTDYLPDRLQRPPPSFSV